MFSKKLSNGCSCNNTAILCNLYYMEMIEYFYSYLDKIPKEIDIYFFSSKKNVIEALKEHYLDSKNVFVNEKANRGRDISALLVAGQKIIKKYQYICFVHDKKELYDVYKQDTEIWKKNLWDNTLASPEYVRNVINYFETNNRCGLLIPPERFSNYFNDWVCGDWGDNYNNTVQLAKNLGLTVTISKELPSFSLGTVFWCRVEALLKLFDYEWKYEDFHEEPMPEDGTISHAIERILPYVVEDAGYDTETIMTEDFGVELLSYSKNSMGLMFCVLKGLFGSLNINDIKHMVNFISYMCQKNIAYKDIYLYGAGKEGEYCLRLLKTLGIMPKGFIVTRELTTEVLDGINVYTAEEILSEQHKYDGVIVITPRSEDVKSEIKKILDNYGVIDVLYWRI